MHQSLEREGLCLGLSAHRYKPFFWAMKWMEVIEGTQALPSSGLGPAVFHPKMPPGSRTFAARGPVHPTRTRAPYFPQRNCGGEIQDLSTGAASSRLPRRWHGTAVVLQFFPPPLSAKSRPQLCSGTPGRPPRRPPLRRPAGRPPLSRHSGVPRCARGAPGPATARARGARELRWFRPVEGRHPAPPPPAPARPRRRRPRLIGRLIGLTMAAEACGGAAGSGGRRLRGVCGVRGLCALRARGPVGGAMRATPRR